MVVEGVGSKAAPWRRARWGGQDPHSVAAEQLVESLHDAGAKSALRQCVLLGDGGRPRDALADPGAQRGPVLGHPGAEALPDLERLNDPKALEPAPQTLLRDAHLLCVGD